MAWWLSTAMLHAAPAGFPAHVVAGDTITYTVRRGDTLPRLAAFLTGEGTATALAQRNGLQPGDALPVGRTLTIPVPWLRSTPVEARILAFRGDVRIEGAPPPVVGAALTEGTRVSTGPKASISLRLPDKSTVTLPSLSTVRIVRLRHVALGDVFDRRFVLEAGRSQYEVTPNHREGSRFDVQTPVSVAAVRGTIFRVSLPEGGGANAEVLRGDVAVAGVSAGIDLPEGYGAHSDQFSTGLPVKLLGPPRIEAVKDTELGPETVQLDAVPGAANYRVQLARDVNFTDVLAENNAAAPAVLIPPTKVGTYYLRATAFDVNGIEGVPDTAIYDHIPNGGGRTAPARK